jgi:uncharacterized membrane protein YgaE (UPF0421/DUF939 family)
VDKLFYLKLIGVVLVAQVIVQLMFRHSRKKIKEADQRFEQMLRSRGMVNYVIEDNRGQNKETTH